MCSSDLAGYFLGGYSGSFFDALKEIPAMKRTSYSAHSCPGTGAFRCMPINIPVRLTPDLINIKPSIISSVN